MNENIGTENSATGFPDFESVMQPVPLGRNYQGYLRLASGKVTRFPIQTVQDTWAYLHALRSNLNTGNSAHVIHQKHSAAWEPLQPIGKGTWAFQCIQRDAYDVFRDLLLVLVGNCLPQQSTKQQEIIGVSFSLKPAGARIELHSTCDKVDAASIDELFIFGLHDSIQHLYYKVTTDNRQVKRISRISKIIDITPDSLKVQ